MPAEAASRRGAEDGRRTGPRARIAARAPGRKHSRRPLGTASPGSPAPTRQQGRRPHGVRAGAAARPAPRRPCGTCRQVRSGVPPQDALRMRDRTLRAGTSASTVRVNCRFRPESVHSDGFSEMHHRTRLHAAMQRDSSFCRKLISSYLHCMKGPVGPAGSTAGDVRPVRQDDNGPDKRRKFSGLHSKHSI